ncbi:hypothetical protein KP509_31G039400 [Ceratopteris richardii]|uniref:CCHC-type domain-containing protein n=1 Tax=Ceratopteris richardii TaxID=49495 RepID=A0A8T2QZ35_CERRI|nr:hypothetical protein KP509_31G039400 [Ceratopteris richardii]
MASSLDMQDTQPLVNSGSNIVPQTQTPLVNAVDVDKLRGMMEDALTGDENVQGDIKVDVDLALIWESTLIFHDKGLLLFFTSRISLAADVAFAINANVGKDVIDKVVYSGHGLFEVIFNDNDVKLQFLEKETVFLCGLIAYVFPWKPVKAMKEELLYKCPVWVELVDLPSLWTNIGNVAKVLGKVLYILAISAPNKNRICVLWNTSRPFPKTLDINVPSVGKIVIYLKWGNMACSCFHCGNLGHYSKNCPSLKTEGVNLIPTCPGSKILVPEEQIFGKQRVIPLNNVFAGNMSVPRPQTDQGFSLKGKEKVNERQVHPLAPVTLVKLNVYKRREDEGVSKEVMSCR